MKLSFVNYDSKPVITYAIIIGLLCNLSLKLAYGRINLSFLIIIIIIIIILVSSSEVGFGELGGNGESCESGDWKHGVVMEPLAIDAVNVIVINIRKLAPETGNYSSL